MKTELKILEEIINDDDLKLLEDHLDEEEKRFASEFAKEIIKLLNY